MNERKNIMWDTGVPSAIVVPAMNDFLAKSPPTSLFIFLDHISILALPNRNLTDRFVV